MILVLGKAMNILELLAQNPYDEIPLGRIAEKLNMDRGTCANIIKSLASRGYVQQTGPRQGYKLGYMIYDLANSAVFNDDLTEIAQEDIVDLGVSLNESVILSVIRNDKRVVLIQIDPNRNFYVRTHIDKPVYSANTGRVILAYYSPAAIEKFISRVGLPTREQWPEIYCSENIKGELMNELCTIKRNGYSLYKDKNEIVGFAAPIFNNGHVAGGLGVYLPHERLEDKDLILEKVLSCARCINNKVDLRHKI